MQNKPSRRLFLAAGSATTVFASLTAAAAGAEASPLAAAIARHRAAYAAFGEACKLEDAGLMSATDYRAADDAEEAALLGVGRAPCATEAANKRKMRYLVDYLRKAYGPQWAENRDQEALALALEMWLGGGA